MKYYAGIGSRRTPADVMEVMTNVAQVLDTMDRDILYDLVAQELGFRFWPCNGDSDELKEAFEEALDKSFI